MNYQFSPELTRLIEVHLATGRYASADELLREALVALQDDAEDLEAIQRGLESADRGDQGLSIAEASAAIRKKYNIADDS